MHIVPSTIVQAWGDFYAGTPLKAPVTEADYLELKTLANYLLDHHNVETEPYAALFDLVTEYMDRWERANEPELKDIQVPPYEMLGYYLENRGVTQYRLAKDLGVSQGNISSILRGDRGISVALAKKLADYFGVSLELFV